MHSQMQPASQVGTAWGLSKTNHDPKLLSPTFASVGPARAIGIACPKHSYPGFVSVGASDLGTGALDSNVGNMADWIPQATSALMAIHTERRPYPSDPSRLSPGIMASAKAAPLLCSRHPSCLLLVHTLSHQAAAPGVDTKE